MDEYLFFCWGCGDKKPADQFVRGRYGAVIRRCGACTHSKDPKLRGSYGDAPGMDRVLSIEIPRMVQEMADELDTPDPTNAELASIIRKRLPAIILEAMVRAKASGDVKSARIAQQMLDDFEKNAGEKGASWLLDSPAGATDSE